MLYLFLPLILLGKNRKHTNIVVDGKLFPSFFELCQMLLTFTLVVLGWVIFCAESISQAWQYVCGIFDVSLFAPFTIMGWNGVLLCLIVMVLVEWLQRDKRHGLDLINVKNKIIRWCLYLLVFVIIIFFGGHSENFIYFQF